MCGKAEERALSIDNVSDENAARREKIKFYLCKLSVISL